MLRIGSLWGWASGCSGRSLVWWLRLWRRLRKGLGSDCRDGWSRSSCGRIGLAVPFIGSARGAGLSAASLRETDVYVGGS